MLFTVLFSVLLSLGLSLHAQAETVLSRKYVIEKILADSRESRRLDLNEQSAYTNYYRVYGNYDFTVAGNLGFDDSQIRYLSGGGNLEDKTTTFTLTGSKRLSSGTTLGVNWTRNLQDSLLRSNQNFGGRSPFVVYDVGQLTVTQDLLGNFLGISERKVRDAAEISLQSAKLANDEGKETLLLNTLTLFWNAYAAQQTLQEANFQKDKYEELVKEIENKKRLSFVMPGDLPKAKAEYGAQVRNVKNATYQYSLNLELLLTALRVQDGSHNVRFDVAQEEVPQIPTMVMPDVLSLRSVMAAEKNFQAADLTQKSVELLNKYPDLKLTGLVGLTGLGSSSSEALSDLGTKNYPHYAVALQMNYRFGSDTYRGNLNEARVAADLAYNTMEKQKEDMRQVVGTAMEQVRFTYAAAVSAIDELENWKDALKGQETNFRQGRVDFSQLIIDYNSYYTSRTTRIKTISDYHIALDTYLGAVDDLYEK